MTQQDTEVRALIQLLEVKLKLLDEILDITKKQTSAVIENNMDSLNILIKDKQLRIDRIDKIDEGFIRQFDGIKKKYCVNQIGELDSDKNHLANLKSITEKVYNKLNQIHQVEERNNQDLKNSYEDIKGKLRDVQKGKKVTSGYYKKPTQAGGYFIDKKK